MVPPVRAVAERRAVRFQNTVQEELEKAAAETQSEAEAETGFWLDFPLRLYDPEDE